MALSTTSKFAIGGSLGTVTVGGPVAAYSFWDQIILYAVEREVINENVKLKVSKTDNNNKSITVSIDTTNGGKSLKSGVWTCLITSKEDINNLIQHIQSHLQAETNKSTSAEEYRDNKKLLVEACSKSRTVSSGENNKTTITGSLTLKLDEKSPSKFTFEGRSDLDFLLDNALYKVEKEVASGVVAISVEEVTAQTSSKKIKVNTSNGDDCSETDTSKKYWECTVTTSSNVTIAQATLQGKLPTPSSDKDETKLNNLKMLVQKCSDDRNADTATQATQKRVKAKIDLSQQTSSINSETAALKYIFGK